MKPILCVFFLTAGFILPRVSASVASFGNSTQNVTFTGIGANAQGQGVSSVMWGNCAYDGKNTTCTVSAPYTGEGNGGTISLIITYPGNGPVPLTATSITPGDNHVNLSLNAGSFVVTLADSNGTTATYYYATHWMFQFQNAVCTGLPTCSVGQVGLTPNATISGPVAGTFDTTPMIATPNGVISAFQYGGFTAVSPGDWMEIFGENLATVLPHVWQGSDFKNGIGPTTLAGTTVTIGGQPAFIDYAGPGQVNAQVPSGVPTGSQPVVVTTAGGSSAAFMIQVNETEPGLLAPRVFRLQAGQYVVAVFPDGYTYALPPGSTSGALTQRAKPGDVLTMYGVGFGPVTPDIPAGQIVSQSNNLAGAFKISIGGTPALVDFAGLTAGFLGLYQFNVTVPNVPANDATPVTFTLNGTPGTQSLLIPIGN